MRKLKSFIRNALFILSIVGKFMRRPKKTYKVIRRAIRDHKPAWYYFNMPKSVRRKIKDGAEIRTLRKALFKHRHRRFLNKPLMSTAK